LRNLTGLWMSGVLIITKLFISLLSLLQVLSRPTWTCNCHSVPVCLHWTRQTNHASVQLEWYKNDVNDKSVKVSGGLQCILTNDGYVIPISMRDGLPYVTLCPYTDDKWEILPHIILSSDVDGIQVSLTMILMIMRPGLMAFLLHSVPPHTMLGELGDYWSGCPMIPSEIDLMSVMLLVTAPWSTPLTLPSSSPPASDNPNMEFGAHAHEIKQHAPDYKALSPMFLWILFSKLLRLPPSMHGFP